MLYSKLVSIVRHYQVTTPITTFYVRLRVETVLLQHGIRSCVNLQAETHKTLVLVDLQQRRRYIGRGMTNALALL